MERDQWLDGRRRGIGGSDISAMLGMNKWRSPLDLWMSKTGRSDNDPGNEEAMYWGSALEDLVARRYAEVTGRRVQRINAQLQLPNTVAICNIDRAVINPEIAKIVRVRGGHRLSTDRILECKTAHALADSRGDDWGEPGTDMVPGAYWLQCQWYLGITGAKICDLAVLFGGQRHLIYTIDARRDIFDDLLETAEDWWMRHVDTDTPPEPSTSGECRAKWKSHTAGKTKAADITVYNVARREAVLKREIKEREQEIKDIEPTLLMAFEDAETLEFQGRKIATWKTNKASDKTDWKAIAEAFQPDEGMIRAFTETKPGARVLRLKTKELLL